MLRIDIAAFYTFDAVSGKLISEKIYYDQASVLERCKEGKGRWWRGALQEEPILNLCEFDGHRASFVVVRDVVDPGAYGSRKSGILCAGTMIVTAQNALSRRAGRTGAFPRLIEQERYRILF